jgi:hypothetical protein
MRNAKPALSGCAILFVAVLFSGFGKADAPPATQPSQPKLADLSNSIKQDVNPTDSVIKRSVDTNGKQRPPDKVVAIQVPKEYADWFKQQTSLDALELQHIEAQIDGYGIKVSLEGKDEQYTFARLPGGPEQKTGGWKMTVAQLKSTDADSKGIAVLDGEIQIDVYPDHRCVFPFNVTIQVDPEVQRHLSAPPLKGTITWVRPVYSKKDEK